jgi:hypothetical protein
LSSWDVFQAASDCLPGTFRLRAHLHIGTVIRHACAVPYSAAFRARGRRTGEGCNTRSCDCQFSGGPLNFPESALAAATPSPSPSIVSSDSVSALPSWLLVALLGVVTLVIVAGFALTAYSLSAPRSTLKNILGRSEAKRPWNIWDVFGRRPSSKGDGVAPRKAEPNKPPPELVTAQLVKTLATSARSGRRTTRTTLAIVGFSLLGVVLIAIFGLSGQGVRDLRSQVVAAVTTLVATIAGFYFGAETARNRGSQSGSAGTAPTLSMTRRTPVSSSASQAPTPPS